MKAVGIVRRIDSLGRIVLPKELLNILDIHNGNPMGIFVDGDNIVLQKGLIEETADKDKSILHKRIAGLTIENAQLRDVITQIDPAFFKRKCHVCGCDWNHPCNDHDCWVTDDLCSACAEQEATKEAKV